MIRPMNVTAQGMPKIGEIGEDQSPPDASIQSTIDNIFVWFGQEYGKTTIWLRACSDAPNFQLRSERPGYWITEIFNRTQKANGCSPSTNSAWRMVYNAVPGMQFNIYATASESWYSESEFMARALRTTCTVTGYGTGYCTPSNILSPVSVPRGWIDNPAAGANLTGIVNISGWAVDAGSKSGTGVDEVRVYFNNTFLGIANYGTPRSDVAAAQGDSRYTNSGWHMTLDTASLPAGPGILKVAYRSTISGVYAWMERNVSIIPPPPVNQAPNPPTLLAPANAVVVTTPNVTLAVQDGGDPDNGPRTYRDFFFRITKSDNTWSTESGWTTSTSWNVTLPGYGKYYWQAMAGDGAAASAWAGPRSLFYTIATPIEPPPPPPPTPGVWQVPYLSQLDPRWKNIKINTNGLCNGTIGSIGCALTSLTMLLRYYGSDNTPATLNTCMGSYACPLYWGSHRVGGCSANKVRFVNRIEDRTGFSYERLQQELTKGPVILGLVANNGWGHFVVVLGGSGTNPANYIVNDPGMLNGERTTLAGTLAWLRKRINPTFEPRLMLLYTGTPAPVSLAAEDTTLVLPEALQLAAGEIITGSLELYRNTETEMVLKLVAQSTLGTVSEMRLWTQEQPSDVWQPFASYVEVPLSAAYYVQYRDDAGNVSPIISADPPVAPPSVEQRQFLVMLPLVIR